MLSETFALHRVLALSVLLLTGASLPASAQDATRAEMIKTLGFLPRVFEQLPRAAMSGVWAEIKGLQMNPNTALTGKSKELIGLGVAAQIPCRYCVYAHSEFAKLNGASPEELAEAVAVAGLSRFFTTITHGARIDDATGRADQQRIFERFKQPHANLTPIQLVDAASARKDIEQTLGFVPAFLARVPEAALAGAWSELKDLRLSPSQLDPKSKALIALAVAAQVPSAPCIASETELAKLAGASEREIAEAIGMAALTRNMSTLANGQLTDEKVFRADIDKLIAGIKAAQKKAQVVSKK
jgi:AhpD family alkylhydroperoxidase